MPEISTRQLKHIPLFSDLGTSDLRTVADLFQRTEYSAGTEVCRQGQLGVTAYYVESGELRVLYVDPQGTLWEVGRKGPGDFFGESSLLLGEPRDVTIEVTQDAVLLYINKGDLETLMGERPSIPEALQMREDVEKKRNAPRFKWQDRDEVIIINLHKHNVILYQHLIFPIFVLLTVISGCAYWYAQSASPLALLAGIVLSLAPLLFSLYLAVDHFNDNYVVTNKRVVHEERVPLLRESRSEAPLRTVQDIQESQEGILAQIYNYGNLIIETAGERGHVVFRQIANPQKVRDTIFEQIQRVQASARAEERAAIRDAMERHFGISQRKEPAAAPPSPAKKRKLQLTIPSWLKAPFRIFNYLIPPLWHEQGETITWRKHWIALIKPVWLPTLLILLVTVGAIFLATRESIRVGAILVVYATVLVFLLPWWIWQFDDWQNDIYQVTSSRIIDVERLPFYLREDRREASLGVIQNINLEIPGFLAKLLNYGSVTIETAGMDPFTFDLVKNPRGVQAEIFKRVEAFQSRLRKEEAERHRAELLNWFSVYDRMRNIAPPPTISPSSQQEIQQ
jgi:uncharacterized membrane protein YdbT with pleckstrin-like domain